MLAGLLLGGGFLYWYGLVVDRRSLIGVGAGALLLALAIFVESDGIALAMVPAIILLGLWAYALRRFPNRPWLLLGWTVFVAVLLALGFRALPYLSPTTVTLPLAEQTFQFPPEKLILLLVAPPMVLVPWSLGTARVGRRPWLSAALILLATLAVVLPLALAMNFIRPGLVTMPAVDVLYWLSYNLIFTCVLEEAFFRGMVQPAFVKGLSRRLSANAARYAGIAAAAALFGLAHISGGMPYVILAGLAGFGYGLAYDFTGRLHFAVLVHFGVNAVRLLAFSGA